MSKNQGVPAKIAAGVHDHLKDSQGGRRSVRWLAERSGIPYATLQGKLSRTPEKFTITELIKIADALGVSVEGIYLDEEVPA